MMRKNQFSIRLDPEQGKALRKLSQRTLIPQSVIVRKGVDMAMTWFEEREELIEKGLRSEEKSK